MLLGFRVNAIIAVAILILVYAYIFYWMFFDHRSTELPFDGVGVISFLANI